MHKGIKRAAARRSVRVDLRRDVLKANGTQVLDYLGTLRAQRDRMTDSAYAFAYRAVLVSRRATRQSVEDRMRDLTSPRSAGGSNGR
ncbi:hypothetical protein [Streptomyces sp. Midd1]|uniref:hypothetical protein n=1 Tax=Streptomyces sp. Midd3 TaxID=3161191 RepID=UPI0034DB574A